MGGCHLETLGFLHRRMLDACGRGGGGGFVSAVTNGCTPPVLQVSWGTTAP